MRGFKIEHDVPVPEKRRGGKKHGDGVNPDSRSGALRRLYESGPGASCVFPTIKRTSDVRVTVLVAGLNPRDFTCQKTPDGIRVWRIEQ